jgi:hypothetical protein
MSRSFGLAGSLLLGCMLNARFRRDVQGNVGILPGPSRSVRREFQSEKSSEGLDRSMQIALSGRLEGTRFRSHTRDIRHVSGETHSNCRAAIGLGKPVTMHVISHGRILGLLVRAAPPFAMPLCCPSLLTRGM